MFPSMLYRPLLAASAMFSALAAVAALGTACTAPLGGGNAAPGAPYWMETIAHQGIAPYSSSPSSYTVFRNVKSYGAKGDGQTDDTAAINAAISGGGRCGQGCDSSTVTPAVVYFPKGTYLISAPIIPFYYTQLIGDARTPPTLLAAASFSGFAVIDADPYIPNGGGAQYWVNQNNFFRSVRNLVIDLTQTPSLASTTALHWQVSQATSLMNIYVKMSTDPNTGHQGMFMENGSGGFMGDLRFDGGRFGIWVGNQQFTVRNVTFNNAQNAAIYMNWNWGWTFQGVTINNCKVGFDIATGGTDINSQTSGAEAILDAVVTNTPIFIRTSKSSSTVLTGSLLIDNAKLTNVATAAVYDTASNRVVLAGGTTTISSWGQGNVYTGTTTKAYQQGSLTPPSKPSVLLDSAGRIFGRSHPQYESYDASLDFISVRSQGAKGDGISDDTAILNSVLSKYAGCKIIFFDAGTYFITSTLKIPIGAQIVGEAWTVIMGGGSYFADYNSPQVMVQAGAPGSIGTLEISDIIFATKGPAPGAIVLEWNAAQGSQGSAGTWDSHIRLGSAAGTNLGSAQCNKGLANTGSTCYAAFLGLHLTTSSTAYIEGMWVWLGDHDLDGDHSQVTVYSGRGILSESSGPVWLIGTGSEHHVIYNYGLVNAKNHFMGLIQTETPYWQPLAKAKAAAAASTLSVVEAGNTTVSPIGWARAQAIFQGKNGSLRRRAIKPITAVAALPTGWSSVGCLTDNSSRLLAAYSVTSSSNTGASCAATCQAQGYTIAGTEYGQECWCANEFGFAQTTSTACTVACSGDSTEICGGSWALNVYQYTAPSSGSLPSGWTAGGCVVDTSSRILTGYNTASSSNTPTWCINTCASLGYKISGTEYGDECYCGNGYNGGTPATAPSTDCNMACAGDSSQMCGAGWRLNIYTSSSSGGGGGSTPSNGPFPINSGFHDPSPLPDEAWGLYTRTSSGILIYGAGLYNFFQNYNQDCLSTASCQTAIIDVDAASQLSLYSLSTIGVVDMLSEGGSAFAPSSQNTNGYQSTITAYFK